MVEDKKSFSEIVSFYEENLGFITSSITDKLTFAMKLYPQELIVEAIINAKLKNNRSWFFIQNFLEKRSHATHQTRKEKNTNAKSSGFSIQGDRQQDPYKSVITRSWPN